MYATLNREFKGWCAACYFYGQRQGTCAPPGHIQCPPAEQGGCIAVMKSCLACPSATDASTQPTTRSHPFRNPAAPWRSIRHNEPRECQRDIDRMIEAREQSLRTSFFRLRQNEELGRRQTKRAATDKPNLPQPRYISNLPRCGIRLGLHTDLPRTCIAPCAASSATAGLIQCWPDSDQLVFVRLDIGDSSQAALIV